MTSVRWKIAMLCLLGNSLSWLDRSALGVALPFMKNDLGLSPVQAGYAFSAFVALYFPAIIVSGILADRFGARRLGAIAIGTWSFAVGLMSLVQGAASIIGLRMLLGLAESGGTPSWLFERHQARQLHHARLETLVVAVKSEHPRDAVAGRKTPLPPVWSPW